MKRKVEQGQQVFRVPLLGGDRVRLSFSKATKVGTLNAACFCIAVFFLMAGALHAQTPAIVYDLTLRLDFDKRAYSGTERVTWTNNGTKSETVLLFRLYANERPPDVTSNAPHLTIAATKTVSGAALPFFTEERNALLRVNLRESVPPGASVTVVLDFTGDVPEIDAEETTLMAHVIQQVGAVLNGDEEIRLARATNFRGRGVMFLGTPYPLLAVRDRDAWQRGEMAGVGDAVGGDTAAYRVTVETTPDIKVFTPQQLQSVNRSDREFGVVRYHFMGQHWRDCAIWAGRDWRVLSENVGPVTVRAFFLPEQEAVGRRVLAVAANAVRVFSERFGALPLDTVSIVAAPLPAGLGSAKFSGGGVIAGAFYLDFDAPALRNLPPLVREQRGAVEESLEWTVARTVAQQWWGVVVGSNPAREPLLHEALTNWAAELYYSDTHGAERAQKALDGQVRGVYKVYRTFGGQDGAANRPARFYRNNFQYAALVSGKGALMLGATRKILGDDRFFAALRNFYTLYQFRIATWDSLRTALDAQATPPQRKMLARILTRWRTQKRGDEDIAPPDAKLADALGLPPSAKNRKSKDKGNRFARLGKFFWQQVTRIR